MGKPDIDGPLFKRVAIFGVGLLGGSLGMACRRRGVAGEAIGVGRNEARLARACDLGAIDRYTTDAASGFSEADLIVMAAPVRTIVETLPLVRESAPAGAVVTDVGSAKFAIAQAADCAFDGSASSFVGSHPMAGGEQMGVDHAREDLYEGAPCYLTPTERSAPGAVERLGDFWQRLGARVTVIAPNEHDRLVALLSHLPHTVAVALVLALSDAELGVDTIRSLTGPGLRDTTRVAAGSTDMWRDIFQENREETLAAIDAFSVSLARLREAIDKGPTTRLETLLNEASALRKRFEEK